MVVVEIWEMSAREVAAGVRTGRFSSVEAVESSLARIEATNQRVNAIVELDDEQALASAADADRQLRAGGPVGRLHGVPVTFKLNTSLEGRATTSGVSDYRGNLSETTDPQAASWVRAGAVSLGRTNTPAFAIGWTSENDLHGTTANPWDGGRTPGRIERRGGRRGCQRHVLAGPGRGHGRLHPLPGSVLRRGRATADQGSGSRLGRTRCAGPVPGDPGVRRPGAAGPEVDDLRLGLAAMQDLDPRDPSTVPLPRVGEAGPATSSGPMKVAMVIDPGGPGLLGRTGSEAEEATRAAGEWLQRGRLRGRGGLPPRARRGSSLWWKLALAELAIGLRAEVQRAGSEHSKAFFELMFSVHESEFGQVDLPQFLAGQARSGMLRRRLSEFMVDHPLILTPMAGEPPFRMGEDIESVERVAEMMAYAWPSMSIPVLRLPALGLAATRGTGAPVGVQLVGRPFAEDLVLTVGEVIEARSGVVTPVELQTP